MKYIYLARHGKTVWNTEDRVQGQKDSPLTEEGIEQMENLSKFLNTVEFDMAYTSPLKRAVDSTNILVGNRNIPIIEEKKVIEMNLGILEGLKKSERGDFDVRREFSVEGMENFSDVTERTKSFIEDVVKTDFDKIIVVCHSITIRSMLMLWDDRTIETFWNGFKTSPSSLTIVGFPKDSKDYTEGEIILPPNVFKF